MAHAVITDAMVKRHDDSVDVGARVTVTGVAPFARPARLTLRVEDERGRTSELLVDAGELRRAARFAERDAEARAGRIER